MIYSSFNECMVLFHECLFIIIGFRLHFSEFEVAVLKRLKIAPFQLHSGVMGRCEGLSIVYRVQILEALS